MERDPKTRRFLPGNKAAVGNRGNRKPKWRNKNALKHGFFQQVFISMCVDDDGWLKIHQSGVGSVKINPAAIMIAPKRKNSPMLFSWI